MGEDDRDHPQDTRLHADWCQWKDINDVLNTFMAEVAAIINSRPLVPVSTDPDFPLILTPAVLLTQKTEYKFEPIPWENSKIETCLNVNGNVSKLWQECFGRVGRKSIFHYYRVAGSGQRVDGILPKEMWFSSKTRL